MITLLDEDAASPVLVELTALARQKRQLEAERETLRAQQATRKMAQGS